MDFPKEQQIHLFPQHVTSCGFPSQESSPFRRVAEGNFLSTDHMDANGCFSVCYNPTVLKLKGTLWVVTHS